MPDKKPPESVHLMIAEVRRNTEVIYPGGISIHYQASADYLRRRRIADHAADWFTGDYEYVY